MAVKLRSEFKFEDVNSLTEKVQNILEQVGKNTKLKINFDDNMSLSNVEKQLETLKKVIDKNNSQIQQSFNKTFDDVNKKLEQQMKKIENNYKKAGNTDVNTDYIKDKYGKITKAIMEYTDKTGEVIKRNYELSNSLKKVNEQGKFTEKLKFVNDNTLNDQEKIINSLEKKRKKIEQVTGAIVKLKTQSNGEGLLKKATISYTDNDNKAVEEIYKISKEINNKENVIRKNLSLNKIGTNITENVAQSIKKLDKFQNKLQKINSQNLKINNGEQNKDFNNDLKNTLKLIDDIKISGKSISKEQEANINNVINKLQKENEVLKENKKILNQNPIMAHNNRMNSQIDDIKQSLKKDGNTNIQPEIGKDSFGKITSAMIKYEDKLGNIITKNYELGKSFDEVDLKGKNLQKLKIVNDKDLKNQEKILEYLKQEKKQIEEVNNTTANMKLEKHGIGENEQIDKAIISYSKGLNQIVTKTYTLKAITEDLKNSINKTFDMDVKTKYIDNTKEQIKMLEKYKESFNKLQNENFEIGNVEQNRKFLELLNQANTLMDKTGSSGQAMTQSIKTSLDILMSKMKMYNKSIKETNDQNKKSTKIQKDAEIEIVNYQNKIDGLRRTYKDLIKDSDLTKLKEEMRKLAKSKDAEEYSRQLKIIRNEFNKLNNSLKDMKSTNIGSGKMGMLGSIKEAMTKFPIWIGATTVWMEAIHKFKDGVGYIRELDKAQTNISMITDLNKDKVKGLTKEYSDLATQLHSTTKEMMSGSEEFLRAGFRNDEVKGMLKASTIGSGISGQSNEDVSQQLIAISNGFRMADEAKAKGEDLEKYVMHVVDVLSTLDNNSATSFAEIATALGRTSSSAQNAGVSFDNLSSYIAIVSATTRKSAESIGESFKTIFSRYQDIKLGKNKDQWNTEISDVESSLGKIGIHIRKDATHFKEFSQILDELKYKWKGLNDLEKSTVTKSLAGTRQRENLLVLMDNMDKVEELEKKGQNAEGNAKKKYNNIQATSLEAKINDFKHAWEKLYETVISSDFLKKVMEGATKLIQCLDQLVDSSGGLKVSFLGSVLATVLLTKKFKTMFSILKNTDKNGLQSIGLAFQTIFSTAKDGKGSIIGLGKAFADLKGVMLTSVTTPTGLAFLAITASVIGATIAISKYIKKKRKLKEENDKLEKSQKDLNKQIAKNDVDGMKESIKPLEDKQKELNDLFKEKKRLEKEINSNGNQGNMGQLNKVDGDIEKTINQLEKLGYAVDKTSGKIVKLEVTKGVIEANTLVEKVQKERKERVKNINCIIGEIDSYNKLASSQNLDAQQKAQLSQLAQSLQGKIKGLKVSVDKHGNAVIVNTDLLGKNKEMLNKERVAILNNKDAGYAAAKQKINEQIATTKKVIEETSKRLKAYQIEEATLKGKSAGISANLKSLNMPGTNAIAGIWDYLSGKKVDEASEKVKNAKKTIEDSQNQLNALLNSQSKIDLKEEKPNKRDNSEYIPDEIEKNTKAKKANTGATDANREAVNKAKEAVKQYELALKALELQMTKINIELGHFYEHSDNYINKLREKQGLIKQELELNKQQIKTNKELSNSLMSVNGNYASGVGNNIGQQVVENATRYLGTPYVWGGTSPSGFDCSGLVQYVYKQVGVQLNRNTYAQMKQGTPVSRNQLQPGDVIFFRGGEHVGIYAGNGKYIHSPHTGDRVKISDLGNFYTARRMVNSSPSNYRTSTSTYSGKYSNYINEASRQYGVPASLIAAVIKAESNFNPNDRSGAGAIGLMQLMPATARGLGVNNPYDPYQNIMGGTKELSRLMKKYNGNLDLVLAGYNAGEGKVAQYGGVPPFRETQNYIPKVKKFMKEFGGSESSIHSVVNESMDLMGKSMDLEKKNMELQEELHKINIMIVQSRLGKFDDIIKSLDRSLGQFRTKLDMSGKDDTTYISWLSKIEEYTRKKWQTLNSEREYIQREIKSNQYDEKTIEMLKQKFADIGSEMMNINKQVKDLGYELASSKWNAIQQLHSRNIEMITNEMERLSTYENKHLLSIIDLKQQVISQDESNIKKITELIKELNEEAYKEEKPWLIDKVEEYNKELNKANTELIKHKKELEDVKNTFNSLIESIEDKIKQAIREINEEYKKSSEKRRKLFEEAIDKQVRKLEEAKRKLDKTETAKDDYEKIFELQEKISRLDLNDSIEAKKQRNELEKELKKAQRDQRSHEINNEIDERKKRLTDAKDEYNKLLNDYDSKLGESLEDDKLTLEAKQALVNGFIVDLNGNVIDLEHALTRLEDKTGKGLSTTGNKIKKDIIDNLHTVQNILTEFGTLDTTKIDFKPKPVVNVYGAGIDLEMAMSILGAKGYNYIDTKMIDHNKIQLGKNDLVLGSKTTHNGINRDDLGGATRLGGSNRYETAQILQLYKDIQDGKITPVNGIVYGSGIDLKNAMKWLSPLGYRFVDTSKINPSTIRFTQSDLIVGSTSAKNGIPFNVQGVTRLGGTNRFETDKQIEKYAMSQLQSNIDKSYRNTIKKNGRVYGKGIDLENAKKRLKNQGYEFINVDNVTDIKLNPNDIIVGGGIQGKENIYNSGARWLKGKDRYETDNAINEFAKYNNLRGFNANEIINNHLYDNGMSSFNINPNQMANLNNWIRNNPQSFANSSMITYPKPNVTNTSNRESMEINNNVKVVIENLQGNKNDANMVGDTIVNKLAQIMKK